MTTTGTLLAAIVLLAGCQGANPAYRGPEVVVPMPDAQAPPPPPPVDAAPIVASDAGPSYDTDPVIDVAVDPAPEAEMPVDAAMEDVAPALPEVGPTDTGSPAPDSGDVAMSADTAFPTDVAPPAPQVSVAAASVAAGEPVVVSFSGAQGNATDWVGVYLRGENPTNEDPIVSQVWAYLAAPAGPPCPTPATIRTRCRWRASTRAQWCSRTAARTP